MSVRVMSWLWEHSTAKGSELLLLLAIADCADDHGRNAWPSIDTLADKTRMHRRSVQRIIQQMVADGLLEVDENGGRHGTNNYTVILSESNSGSNFEHSEALSTGVAERQGWQNATVASDAPRGGTGATRTIQNHPLPPNSANAGSGCPAHHHPSPNCRGCGTNPRALQKAANIAAIGIACGNCGPGRLIDLDDGRVVKCPHCHPNRGIA